MKFLALSTLSSVGNSIDGLDLEESVLPCKLDCYSCAPLHAL